jgi:hypothetical protein
MRNRDGADVQVVEPVLSGNCSDENGKESQPMIASSDFETAMTLTETQLDADSGEGSTATDTAKTVSDLESSSASTYTPDTLIHSIRHIPYSRS